MFMNIRKLIQFALVAIFSMQISTIIGMNLGGGNSQPNRSANGSPSRRQSTPQHVRFQGQPNSLGGNQSQDPFAGLGIDNFVQPGVQTPGTTNIRQPNRTPAWINYVDRHDATRPGWFTRRGGDIDNLFSYMWSGTKNLFNGARKSATDTVTEGSTYVAESEAGKFVTKNLYTVTASLSVATIFMLGRYSVGMLSRS